MSEIQTIGTYRGVVLTSAVNTTQKGFPQWVAVLKVTEKFVETAAEMEHFGIAEPGWVDYSTFDQQATGYFVLFNAEKELLNYEQVQKATGWDGVSFDTLDGVKDMNVLFRVEEDTYNDKTSLKVQWIDQRDASPTKILKTLDAAGLKALSANFLKKKAPVVAVSAAKPANPSPASGKPLKSPSLKPSTPSTPAVTATQKAPDDPSATKKSATSKSPKATTPPPTPAPEEATGLPVETSQGDAWEAVQAAKGDNDDATIQEAWISACTEVAEGRREEQFTPKDWARIRDLVFRDCGLI